MEKDRHGRFWLMAKKALLATLVALAVVGCGGNAPVQTGEVVTAFTGDLSASATASGQVQASREATLSFPTPGIVAAVHVRVGDVVQEGEVLAELDTTARAISVATAEQTVLVRQAQLDQLLAGSNAADIAAAQAGVASAQANLDTLLAGPRPEEITAAEADLRAAQAAVAATAAQLNSTQDSVSDAELEAARAQLVAAEYQLAQAQEINDRIAVQQTDIPLQNARNALEVAQANFDSLQAGPDINSVRIAQADVSSASAQSARAQNALDSLLAGPTEAEITAAQLQLAQAQANLDALLNSTTDPQVRIAQAELQQAQLQLADAQEQLEKGRITAPFAGVVTAVYINEGELASGRALDVVDTNSYEVILNIDEADIGIITIGQPATILLEAWPNDTITSQVRSIAPSGTNGTTGLVSYQARLTLETELPVRVGMTANATLVTAERTNVLLVPNRAITANRQTGQYFVTRKTGETTSEQVEITIGLRDETATQVLSGLQAGDELIIGNTDAAGFGPGQNNN